MLLREPLDGAGNRGYGNWSQQAQVRDLRRTRPCARGFPSVACDAPLARFASAALFPPLADLSGRSTNDWPGEDGLLLLRMQRLS